MLDADFDFGLELIGELGGFLIDAVLDASFSALRGSNYSDGLIFLSLKNPKTLRIPQALIEDENLPS